LLCKGRFKIEFKKSKYPPNTCLLDNRKWQSQDTMTKKPTLLVLTKEHRLPNVSVITHVLQEYMYMWLLSVQIPASLCNTQCYFCDNEHSNQGEVVNASDCITTTICAANEVYLLLITISSYVKWVLYCNVLSHCA